MIQKSIASRYLSKIAISNLLIVIIVFVLLFTVIDSTTTVRSNLAILQFGISLCMSIINLDSLSNFVFAIATLITLLKLKSSNQDIALISLDISPGKIFGCITSTFVACYIFYLTILHTGVFYALKHLEKLAHSGRFECIRTSSGSILNEEGLKINIVKYNICDEKNFLIYDLYSGISKAHELSVTLYENNDRKALLHQVDTNEYKMIEIAKKDRSDIKVISKIDTYRNDIKTMQISLYHLIYTFITDKNGIISHSDIIDFGLNKLKNIIMIAVCINACYFVMMQNKRARKTGLCVIKTLIFLKVYYIISYIISEKIRYAELLLFKIIFFILIHLVILYIMKYFQSSGVASLGEVLEKVTKAKKIKF